MRLREAGREAVRNFAVGASRGLLCMTAFLAIATLAAVVSSRAVVAVSQDAIDFRRAGASVYRLDAPGSIDGDACDNLRNVEGVSESGATRLRPDLRFALLPDLPIPYLETTPGMFAVLSVKPALPDVGLVVDSQFAESLAISVPSETFLRDRGQPVQIEGTFEHPDDGRDATLSGAALGLVNDGRPFDSCWALFWPPTTNPLDVMGPTVIRSESGSGSLVQWNPSLGRSIDPAADFQQLPLVWIGIAGAAGAATVSLVSIRARRLELASALHVGVRRSDLLVITMIEILLWLLPATVIAIALSAIASVWANPDPLTAAWFSGSRAVIAAGTAWLVTAAVAAVSIRESHLVRYFQQR